jgi:hypothetical protein
MVTDSNITIMGTVNLMDVLFEAYMYMAKRSWMAQPVYGVGCGGE